MRTQTITTTAWDRSVSYKIQHDMFTFRNDRNHKWLQRICINILRRLHCHKMEEQVAYQQIRINGDTFMERLLNSYEWLAEEFGILPHSMIIGSQDFDKLMHTNSLKMRQAFTFNTQYASDRYTRGELFGMKVCVIPWMEGFVIMPPKAR